MACSFNGLYRSEGAAFAATAAPSGPGMRYNFDDWSFGIDNADIGADSLMLGIGWGMK